MAGEAVWRGGDGGLWRCKGWETLGSQTPTKTGAAGGQTPSGAWDGTAHSRIEGRRLAAVRPGTMPPAQSVADLFRHCLRQQAERLPPGCPEGFSVLTQSTDRSVSEDRTEAAVPKGLEE